MMNVLLIDTNANLCEAWRTAFAGIQGVGVRNDRFESHIGTFDCFVSPANSFGLMDGGIDLPIIEYFGLALQDRVQQAIWQHYRGEQPIGTCLMVPTELKLCPWLAHCPTMRTPRDVAWTNNAYAAFLAALTTAESSGVQTLGCPGLATLTGQMPPDVAAAQMRYAYDQWLTPFKPSDWTTLRDREWRSHGRSRADFLRHTMKL